MYLIGTVVAADGTAPHASARRTRWLNRMLVIPLGLALLMVGFEDAAASGPGALDKSFGRQGRVETDFGARDGAQDVAVTSAGTIVVVGQTDSGGFQHGDVAVYRPNGHVDRGFSGNGKLRVPFQSGAVAIQSRHRFLVAGPTEPGSSEPGLVVAAYRANGRLDESFGSLGVAMVAEEGIGFATDMVVLPDRSLLVLTQFGLWRLRPDGKVDTAFGTDGQAVAPTRTELYELALQSNGRIVVGATSGGAASLRLRAVRFRAGGQLDTSFARDGVSNAVDVSHTASWAGVGVQSSGKIVLAGATTVARFTTHGTLDRDFGSDGIAPGYFLDEFGSDVSALLIQSDDRIVLVGRTRGPRESKPVVFAVARLLPGGTRDRSFSGDGIAITPFSRRYSGASGAALDARGRILAVGATGPPGVLGDFALARYLA